MIEAVKSPDSALQIDESAKLKSFGVARLMADHAFQGRDGHGGKGSGVGYRQIRRDELQALLALAFQYGVQWEGRR
jgi:hypothetical protein